MMIFLKIIKSMKNECQCPRYETILKINIFLDIDNNGVLNQHDFECMALKMTLMEGKGDFNYNRYQENLHIMLSLWEEIAELADFNKVLTIFNFI